MDVSQAVPVFRRRRGSWVLAAAVAVVAAAVVVAVVAGTAAVDAVTTDSPAETADGGSFAAAAALTPVGRTACPSGKCRCKQMSVKNSVARAGAIIEVLVLGCGGGSYTVRINQYFKGCSRQYVVALCPSKREAEGTWARGEGRRWRGRLCELCLRRPLTNNRYEGYSAHFRRLLVSGPSPCARQGHTPDSLRMPRSGPCAPTELSLFLSSSQGNDRRGSDERHHAAYRPDMSAAPDSWPYLRP